MQRVRITQGIFKGLIGQIVSSKSYDSFCQLLPKTVYFIKLYGGTAAFYREEFVKTELLMK